MQAVFRELLQEAQAVDAGEADIESVDVRLDLRDEGAVVAGVEGRPELLDDLAARILEAPLKAADALMAVGEIVGNRRHALEAERLCRVLAERVGDLRRRTHGVHDPGIGLALLQIDRGRRSGRDQRHLRLRQVTLDGERLEGGERSDDGAYLVSLDELLRLAARGRGLPRGVGGEELYFPAGERAVALFQEKREAFFHLLAAGGQRAGRYREKADAQWPGFAPTSRRQQAGCGGEAEDAAARDSQRSRHLSLTAQRALCARRGIGPSRRRAPWPRAVTCHC